jgi:hypothetical protein
MDYLLHIYCNTHVSFTYATSSSLQDFRKQCVIPSYSNRPRTYDTVPLRRLYSVPSKGEYLFRAGPIL